jgi:hypothetical protein
MYFQAQEIARLIDPSLAFHGQPSELSLPQLDPSFPHRHFVCETTAPIRVNISYLSSQKSQNEKFKHFFNSSARKSKILASSIISNT